MVGRVGTRVGVPRAREREMNKKMSETIDPSFFFAAGGGGARRAGARAKRKDRAAHARARGTARPLSGTHATQACARAGWPHRTVKHHGPTPAFPGRRRRRRPPAPHRGRGDPVFGGRNPHCAWVREGEGLDGAVFACRARSPRPGGRERRGMHPPHRRTEKSMPAPLASLSPLSLPSHRPSSPSAPSRPTCCGRTRPWSPSTGR